MPFPLVYSPYLRTFRCMNAGNYRWCLTDTCTTLMAAINAIAQRNISIAKFTNGIYLIGNYFVIGQR